MAYTDFDWTAKSGLIPQTWELPARSVATAANLYIRVTGIAEFPGDPSWEGLEWRRGTLAIKATLPTDVLQFSDVLVESCATAAFRHLTREEEGSTDDFGIALDEVTRVELAGQELTVRLNAAFTGDVWMPTVSFTADLLVYRQSLDGQPVNPLPPSPWDRYLRDAIRDVSKYSDLLKGQG